MKKRAFSLPLGFLVFFLLAAVILPAGLLILLTYQGASALLVEQAGGSYRELLSLKQQEIDHRLLVAGVFLDNLVSSNNQDFLIARFTTDRNRYMHTKYAIYRSVIDHIPMIGNIDFFYFYNRRFDDDMMISVNSQFRAENEMLRRDLTSMYAAEQTLLQWWHCEKRTGGYYLLRSYISDTVMIVLGINLAHLLPELPEAAGGDKGFFFFADPRSRVLVSGSAGHSGLPLPGNTGEGGNRGVLQKPSAYGIYTLGLSFNRQELYQQLPATVRFGFLGITLIILAVIVFVYVLLNRLVLHPISLAASVMDRVGFGEMDERLPERVLSRELTLMNRSFNQMLEKITALRMNVYQEHILRQKMELEKLRLQLNPHFLLNSLNAIHTFIGLGYTGSAREFIRCLATHFRFTLQSNDAFTTAGAEIDFLRSYIRLWELQYPKAIQLTVSLPNYLENYRIPQLVLQNLVENSIKYNFDPRSCLVLNIQFSLLEDQDGKAWFFCLYTDNGSGFPRDFLLSANEPPGEEPDRAHIGMYNIRKRLELLYNGISRIEFSNGDKGGSRISMMLPLGLADPANEGEVQNR